MFKVASWNLNSVRSRLTHVTTWLKAREPDVLLLQELKGTEFPSEVFKSLGYESVAVTQKAYNGVAILSRHPIETIAKVLIGDDSDSHARFMEVIIKGIRIVSDGMFLFPFRDERGMIWIPQQMWRFRRLPLGVWTICFHHNRWDARTLERFERDLLEYRDRIVDLDEVIRAYDGRRKAGWEMAASHLMTWAWRLRRRSVRRRLSGSGAYNDRAKADE